MYAEFIGLPGSGKSTLLEGLKRLSAHSNVQCRSLNDVAQEAHAKLLKMPGYISRKPGRGWLVATLTFAHNYPEVFRILFENTIASRWQNRIIMDLLGQFQLAKKARTSRQTVLCDEGFLHCGAYICSKPNAYSDLDTYLTHIPLSNVVVHIELDVETSLARCKTRPKGLPKVYKNLTEEQVIKDMSFLMEMHQKCVLHQENAGVHIIRLDGKRPAKEICIEVYETLVKLYDLSGKSTGRAKQTSKEK